MKIGKVHCLFEQSGTFKKELIRMGIPAEDYDIQDEFGETDHVVDLFSEIEKAYDGKPSIFDGVEKDDLVLAFFPCTRFECVIPVAFRGEQPQQKNWTDLKRLENSMKLHDELHQLYTLICKLFSICLRGGWRMIVENPYTQPHYLTQFFPVRPTIIDKDRTQNGDHFRKPTQYWFLNCKPEQNVVFEPIDYVKTKIVDHCGQTDGGQCIKTARSMIHPQYAKRFIQHYVIDAPGGVVGA